MKDDGFLNYWWKVVYLRLLSDFERRLIYTGKLISFLASERRNQVAILDTVMEATR